MNCARKRELDRYSIQLLGTGEWVEIETYN